MMDGLDKPLIMRSTQVNTDQGKNDPRGWEGEAYFMLGCRNVAPRVSICGHVKKLRFRQISKRNLYS